MQRLPLIASQPPRLSMITDQFRAIEASGTYSNGGAVVRGFEAAATARLFGGQGGCVAVNNATIGLMLAIRHAAGPRAGSDALALVPAFTFAATAQVVQWAGLTPVLCDIDPEDWTMRADAEAAAFDGYGNRIAVVVPYATFGASLDLALPRLSHARHRRGGGCDGLAGSDRCGGPAVRHRRAARGGHFHARDQGHRQRGGRADP